MNRLDDVAMAWKEEHFSKIRNGTRRGYSAALDRLVSHFQGEDINDVRSKHILRFYNRCVDEGLSKSTMRTQKTVVKQVFDYAIVDLDILEVNPAVPVKIPRGLPAHKRLLPSEDDMLRVINSVELPFGLFAYLLLFTGCRKCEALAITDSDIIHNKWVNITKQIEFVHNRPKPAPTKTDSSIRMIPVLDNLASVLPLNFKGYLFSPNDGDETYTESQLRRKWEKYQKMAKISCTTHQLRHGYCTLLYESGIDTKVAQGLMGHSNESTTKDIYTHIRASKKKQAGDVLNNYVSYSLLESLQQTSFFA